MLCFWKHSVFLADLPTTADFVLVALQEGSATQQALLTTHQESFCKMVWPGDRLPIPVARIRDVASRVIMLGVGELTFRDLCAKSSKATAELSL